MFSRMTRGVRLYLVGSFVLVSLAGCGRGFFSEEREPWRAEAEVVQFLPNMTVTHGMPACEGRPDVDVVKSEGIAIAGDWVGSDGTLADAAVSSALRAAAQVQNRTARAAA